MLFFILTVHGMYTKQSVNVLEIPEEQGNGSHEIIILFFALVLFSRSLHFHSPNNWQFLLTLFLVGS